MTVYAVLFHVDDKKLPEMLAVVSSSARLVSVTPTEEKPNETKEQYYVGGKRNKGISGQNLVLQVLGSAKRPFTNEELGKAFIAHGFAEHSYSPSLTELVRAEKVVSAGRGTWALKGTVVHLGAAPKSAS